jgi:hypothetical protein
LGLFHRLSTPGGDYADFAGGGDPGERKSCETTVCQLHPCRGVAAGAHAALSRLASHHPAGLRPRGALCGESAENLSFNASIGILK